MIAGIVLIIAGILIAAFPELLSLIVAFVLISTGITIAGIGYHMKRASRKSENPIVDIIMRY